MAAVVLALSSCGEPRPGNPAVYEGIESGECDDLWQSLEDAYFELENDEPGSEQARAAESYAKAAETKRAREGCTLE